jgi:hypothetical protein
MIPDLKVLAEKKRDLHLAEIGHGCMIWEMQR